MTIDEELKIINDNIDKYGQTNITRAEYAMIFRKGKELYEEKLKLLQDWKASIMESLAKYDSVSIEGAVDNAYNRGINDALMVVKKDRYAL